MQLTIPSAPANESLDAQIARAALSKLTGKTHFSICEVRDALRVMGKKLTPEDDSRLLALHCVEYKQMAAPVVDYLRAIVLSILD